MDRTTNRNYKEPNQYRPKITKTNYYLGCWIYSGSLTRLLHLGKLNFHGLNKYIKFIKLKIFFTNPNFLNAHSIFASAFINILIVFHNSPDGIQRIKQKKTIFINKRCLNYHVEIEGSKHIL